MTYIIIAGISILVIVYRLFPLVWVCGDSMSPTYQDTNIIISRRFYRSKKIKKGDVFVFKHPTVPYRLLIKRVDSVFWENGVVKSIFFLGDNSENSYDSRNFGHVPICDVVSKVMFKREKMED